MLADKPFVGQLPGRNKADCLGVVNLDIDGRLLRQQLFQQGRQRRAVETVREDIPFLRNAVGSSAVIKDAGTVDRRFLQILSGVIRRASRADAEQSACLRETAQRLQVAFLHLGRIVKERTVEIAEKRYFAVIHLSVFLSVGFSGAGIFPRTGPRPKAVCGERRSKRSALRRGFACFLRAGQGDEKKAPRRPRNGRRGCQEV